MKARLAAKGIRVGKNRVLRLMRAHGLLAPVRRGHPRGDRTHSGRIRTERPDEFWAHGHVASAARLGLAVQGKAVPGRDQMAWHPLHARLRG